MVGKKEPVGPKTCRENVIHKAFWKEVIGYERALLESDEQRHIRARLRGRVDRGSEANLHLSPSVIE